MVAGESQGGHIAASLAATIAPDLLILISSLPDRDDVPRLNASNVTVIIGWMVCLLMISCAHTPRMCTPSG